MKSRAFMLMPHDRVDVTKARKFGQIVELFPDGEERPEFWDPELITEALHRLLDDHGFDPAADYFVVAGHMVPVVRLTCALATVFPLARGLFFDSIQRRYVPLPLVEPYTAEALKAILHNGHASKDGRAVQARKGVPQASGGGGRRAH
jgi:hypothetical protein